MAESRYTIGIDLGTTNSALAYIDRAEQEASQAVHLLEPEQLVEAGKLERRAGLPSFLYLPGPHELPDGATALPWAPRRDYVVGTFAREQGTLVPSRLVASAKSWLCHGGVDREAPILPWGAPSEVAHLSPIEASARYLTHLRECWDRERSEGRSEWSLAESEVVLTVPASFDEVARELTVRAARQAGFKRFTLLEEPQAAFYSWLRSKGEGWREELADGQTILVVDVGGGTTDFSLVAVRGSGAEMSLERVAVGDHLMLGGDNLDLALARHLETRLVKRLGELGARQWGSLVHQCRQAKEALLSSDEAVDRAAILLAGRGSKVIGGSVRIDLFRDEVLKVALEGFFPEVPFEAPAQAGRPGLQELGLPYANDPAVTRNLAAFLKRHSARPDAVLFNGGAMKAPLLRQRLTELLGAWFGGPPQVLGSQSLDLAVAMGAAAYGLARVGGGLRIRAGLARAYYVGVAGDRSPAASGAAAQAICLIPFGVEEGEEVSIADRPFELVLDRPVSFPIHSSTAPLGHQAGEVTRIDPELFVELPPIHTLLRADAPGKPGAPRGGAAGRTLPVTLGARLTEVGTLQLWCAAAGGGGRWDLEFSVRGQEEEGRAEESALPRAAVGDATLDISAEQVTEAEGAIRVSLGARAAGDEEGPRRLLRQLEAYLDADRLAWPGAVVRGLWPTLWEAEGHRDRSAEHEAAWLNLAGILLRPGFGDPLDPGRMEELLKVFRAGLRHADDLWCRIAWCVLWRRVSGGLDRGSQLALSGKLAPPLLTGAATKAAGSAGTRSKKGGSKKGAKGAKGADRARQGGGGQGGLNRQELAEMWRTVASLERIPMRSKEGLGDVALRNALAGRGEYAFWAVGRLGARVPLYGATDETVATAKVEGWLERILSADWGKARGIASAAVHLARLSGDPARDIDDRLRDRLVDRLRAADCSEDLIRLVVEVTALREEEKSQLFGDTLPTGLRLT